jgi:hypothetical protein
MMKWKEHAAQVAEMTYGYKTLILKPEAKKPIEDTDTGGIIILKCTLKKQSRDSSVGIALGYGLDDLGSRVRFPAGAGNFSLHHRVQNGSGAHPASYPMGTRGSYRGGKAAGA